MPRVRVLLKRIAVVFLLLLVAGAGYVEWKMGWRNVIGLWRYDQRREGALKVGDVAPDVAAFALDGAPVKLGDYYGKRPVVLVFGSFT